MCKNSKTCQNGIHKVNKDVKYCWSDNSFIMF
jgi:hypothetical protein